MLYTQQFTIPVSGELRIGTIGGQPYEKDSDGREMQIGYMKPVRHGILQVASLAGDIRIFEAVANVSGYNGREINGSKCPCRVIVELPASITIIGEAGLVILVEAWILDSYQDRGASQSFLPAAGIQIPPWAGSFDLAGPGVATFRDATGVSVGVITGNVSNFSIPSRAVTVDLAGASTPIIFRQ